MIDELKRQLHELDRDLAPVLDHVTKTQRRRDALAKAIDAAEAADKVIAENTPPEPIPEPPAPEPTPEFTGKRRKPSSPPPEQ